MVKVLVSIYCYVHHSNPGFYIFYSIFEVNFFVFKDFFFKFCPYVWLVFKSGL